MSCPLRVIKKCLCPNALSFILFLIVSFPLINAQSKSIIEGKVVDARTKAPIPFANIYNKNLHLGTISNLDGYFRIAFDRLEDVILVSSLGYVEAKIELTETTGFVHVLLIGKIFTLDEVVIKPPDNTYLYELIEQCKGNTKHDGVKAKGYFQLKSYIDNSMVELLENYYNVDIEGYHLRDFRLKAGRLALKPRNDFLFVSTESSKAILLLNPYEKSDFFPLNPLCLTKRGNQQAFYLSLSNRYMEDNLDSIYSIDFSPIDKSGKYFNGRVWLNLTSKRILKVELLSENASLYPFLPLFSSDIIDGVRFHITISFSELNQVMVFKHIDFNYQIDYISRVGKPGQLKYSVNTEAVLYAYNFDNLFFIPWFDYQEPITSDYLKINAFPYNDFFWKYNDEYALNDSLNEVELFFSDTTNFTTRNIFKDTLIGKNGLFRYPYVSWSVKRINLVDVNDLKTLNSKQDARFSGFKSELYNLGVKYFVDLNSYSDSIAVLSATIFDPYTTYYFLPKDSKAQCFINIYFDLCEIIRRKYEPLLIKSKSDAGEFRKTCYRMSAEAEDLKRRYYKETEQGRNLKELKKYNDMVFKSLKIDNLALFQINVNPKE